jgi:hypothetical protein
MARPNVDASQLSPQDLKDLNEMNEAARKQRVAAEMKRTALAGVVPPPDPTQPPPQVQQQQQQGPTTPGEISQAQHAQIDMADEARKRDMEAQMAATRAGQSPYAVGSTIEMAQQVAAPTAVPGSTQAAPAVTGLFEIWRAIRQTEDERKMVDCELVYADDWMALRGQLKGKDGEWIAIHYQFPATVQSVLGFFVELSSPYPDPKNADRERFDVIVKGSKIFRSEIEPEEVEAPPAEAPAEEA